MYFSKVIETSKLVSNINDSFRVILLDDFFFILELLTFKEDFFSLLILKDESLFLGD